jgi:polyhydroxyalkanoate synthase
LLSRKNTKQQHRFVLGASGHIAGVINPPKKNKRSYWTNNQASANTNMSAEAWLETATEHPGSWWSEWMAFLADYAGKQVGAPSTLGNATWQAIEPAPGRYVKVRTS